MAVPRLRQARCFWELDRRRLRDPPAAASIGGAAKAGRAVDPRELPHIDLVVAGSVAVTDSPRTDVARHKTPRWAKNRNKAKLHRERYAGR